MGAKQEGRALTDVRCDRDLALEQRSIRISDGSARTRESWSRESWPPERVEKLQRLWALGMTASQVADAMGGTRAAILGKVHRLGMGGRAAAPKVRRPKPTPRPKAPRVEKLTLAKTPTTFGFAGNEIVFARAPGQTLPNVRVFRAECAPQPLETLTRANCRFVVNDGQDERYGFLYCASAVDGERAYCAGHAALMYAPRSAVRLKRPPRPKMAFNNFDLAGWA